MVSGEAGCGLLIACLSPELLCEHFPQLPLVGPVSTLRLIFPLAQLRDKRFSILVL